MAKKEATPKESHKSYSNDLSLFYKIQENIKKYTFLKVGDCVLDTNKTRYIVSSIDEFGVPWMRQILSSGKPSNVEKTFVDCPGVQLTIDDEQIDSILLGAEYDPTIIVKQKTKEKTARRERNKKKQHWFKNMAPPQREQWIIDNLTIGKTIWFDQDDTFGYKITSISTFPVNDPHSKKEFYDDELQEYREAGQATITEVHLESNRWNNSTRRLTACARYYPIYIEKPEPLDDQSM